ncbi:STAS domain-containing protein [Actinoplanes xinjiangensis]|uniref:STAS domain-containing protein n=1 Tax=Actinoplanes xinjiangensis TaxID=512350 RepID=UPI00130D9F9A|nr:STAS domain-containing protein [Actinoplanes xinjiangensis]
MITDDSGTTVLTVSRGAESGHGEGAPAVPWTVVAVDGDVDQDTAPLLRDVLTQAFGDRESGRETVCCDLTRVTFFGAAAANLVLRMHLDAVAAEQCLVLRGATVMTDRVLAIVDPDRILVRS